MGSLSFTAIDCVFFAANVDSRWAGHGDGVPLLASVDLEALRLEVGFPSDVDWEFFLLRLADMA